MNRKPRVLVLLNRAPFPLDDGWKVRTFHLIEAVAHAADVTLLCSAKGDIEGLQVALGSGVRVQVVPDDRPSGSMALLRGLVGPSPFYAAQEQSPAFRASVRAALVDDPDVVLCELTAVYEHVRALGIDERVVIDTHNIDSVVFARYAGSQPSLARRLYARMTAAKQRRYEAEVFARVGGVIVCSTPERPLALDIAPGANVWVIPNGANIPASGPAGNACAGRMFFFGRLDYHPNVDAIEYFLAEIFPRIRSAFPSSEFHVAGGHDDGTVAGLMRAHEGTVFHGRVERLEPLLEEASLVVVPLRVGGGTRLKILEALAARRPVLSTPIGAEGLDLEPGADIALASDAVTFAKDAVALLRDRTRAEALGTQGRRTVERQYSWDAIGHSLVERLVALVHDNRPGTISTRSDG